MTKTEFDWTFDDQPVDDAGPADRPVAPPLAARRPAPAAWLARLRRHSRLLAVLAVLGLIASLAGVTAYLIGWRNLRAQLTREITYEDAQSLDRQVDAVLALHSWASPPWRARRAAEVALGLAAPLPAATLRPVLAPPVVLAVDSVADREFTVLVARQYTDASGQVYTFTLPQRYRNRGPGLWERQPPAPTTASATFSGARLSATFPTADAAWMQTALPQVDALLAQACADWRCPPAARVAVTFTAQLDQLPPVLPGRPTAGLPPPALAPRAGQVLDRQAGRGQGSEGYPAIFDLPFRNPRYPSKLILASPQLAGLPADDLATQALIRAYTADALGQLAADMVDATRTQSRYFLDAMVARMEIRLGLASAPPRRLDFSAYTPIADLWPDLVGNLGSDQPPELAPRLQALWFLNAVLADQPPTADGDLLAHMRWQSSLAHWLGDSLGLDGEAVVAAYEAGVQAQWAATPPDWRGLEGLLYACQSELGFVQNGAPVRLPFDLAGVWFDPQALSPDGRYLAFGRWQDPVASVQVFDLRTQTQQTVTVELALAFGWSADNVLAYFTVAASPAGGALRLYDPRTALTQALPAGPLALDSSRLSWSADHRALALTFAADPPASPRPGVLSFIAPLHLLRLATAGHSPALSPDGRWLAYVTPRAADSGSGFDEPAITFIELATSALYQAQLSQLLPGSEAGVALGGLLWSPDGRRLAFSARTDGPAQLYTLTLRGGSPAAGADLAALPVPAESVQLLGFSADGRYLSLVAYQLGRRTSRLLVFDTTTGALAAEFTGYAAAWAPHGHQLAVTGAAGLYTVEVGTGAAQWLAAGPCTAVWTAPAVPSGPLAAAAQ